MRRALSKQEKLSEAMEAFCRAHRLSECQGELFIWRLTTGEEWVGLAEQLGVTINTVKSTRKALFAKMGVATSPEMYSLFIRFLRDDYL